MPTRLRWFAVPLAVAGAGLLLTAACSDKDEASPTPVTTATGSTAATITTTAPATQGTSSPVEPLLAPPASQFIVLVQDLGIENFLTDLETTAKLTLEQYAATTTFTSASDGETKLKSWGYEEGYRTGLIPEGGPEAMLNGGYVIYQEVHLFESTNGAHEAFNHLRTNIQGNTLAEVVSGVAIANESIASRAIAGKIGSTTADQVLHQVVFRRGNVVLVVLTIGASSLMKIDTAFELAAIADEKLLDEREHPEPTPIPARSPSPTATAKP